MGSEIADSELCLDKEMGIIVDDDGTGLSNPLQSGCQIDHTADHRVVDLLSGTDVTNFCVARGQSNPERKRKTVLLLQIIAVPFLLIRAQALWRS